MKALILSEHALVFVAHGVQAVVAELRGEAIDIIPFSEDPARYVIEAIAPATVSKFILENETKRRLS